MKRRGRNIDRDRGGTERLRDRDTDRDTQSHKNTLLHMHIHISGHMWLNRQLRSLSHGRELAELHLVEKGTQSKSDHIQKENAGSAALGTHPVKPLSSQTANVSVRFTPDKKLS